MKLLVFASGSSGNCALVRGGDTSLLIDAGISLRRIRAALREEGLELTDISGVLITHEHTDHIAALKMLAKYTDVPVYAPGTVAWHLAGQIPELEGQLCRIDENEGFSLDEITVRAFPTPHDTDQSVGYRLEWAGRRLGFCTDTGHVSAPMLENLSGCDAALIEANHDLVMLRNGPYPFPLKKRIVSERGHLSNDDSAVLACALARSGAHSLVLGHLSRENNTPSRAHDTVRRALDESGFSEVKLYVAPVSGALAVEV